MASAAPNRWEERSVCPGLETTARPRAYEGNSLGLSLDRSVLSPSLATVLGGHTGVKQPAQAAGGPR